MSLFQRRATPLALVPMDELQRQIDAGVGAGFRTPEELAAPNESSKGGKSSLITLADNIKNEVIAAERQHAQSLQEVVDALGGDMSRFVIAYDAGQAKLRQAAELAVEGQRMIDEAVKKLVDNNIDTSQMVSKLRDIRIKSPLRDKAKEISKAANQPRRKRG